MRKLIVALVILMLVACGGCIYNPPLEPTPSELTPTPELTPEPNGVSPKTPAPEDTNGIPAPPVQLPPGGEGEPPEDMTWISPGVVEVSYFYPGARAEWPIRLHNGNDAPTTFSIKYKVPDRLREGYEMAPEAARNWVIITDPTPLLLPKETREILIVVELPGDAKVPPKWEFWIAVKDTSQTGFVQTELCSRWLISMV